MGKPKYIVTSTPGAGTATICILEAGDVYEEFAEGDFQALVHVAKLLNAEQGAEEGATELVEPNEIKVGDRVLVEMVVARKVGLSGSRFHIHATPGKGNPWQLGDQYAWTWGWGMSSHGKIERIVNRRRKQ